MTSALVTIRNPSVCLRAPLDPRADALLFRESPVEFFDGDLLHARSDRPVVSERVNHCRHPVAVDNVARFLDRSRARFYGTTVNKVDVGDVPVECAASWLPLFEGPHDR